MSLVSPQYTFTQEQFDAFDSLQQDINNISLINPKLFSVENFTLNLLSLFPSALPLLPKELHSDTKHISTAIKYLKIQNHKGNNPSPSDLSYTKHNINILKAALNAGLSIKNNLNLTFQLLNIIANTQNSTSPDTLSDIFTATAEAYHREIGKNFCPIFYAKFIDLTSQFKEYFPKLSLSNIQYPLASSSDIIVSQSDLNILYNTLDALERNHHQYNNSNQSTTNSIEFIKNVATLHIWQYINSEYTSDQNNTNKLLTETFIQQLEENADALIHFNRNQTLDLTKLPNIEQFIPSLLLYNPNLFTGQEHLCKTYLQTHLPNILPTEELSKNHRKEKYKLLVNCDIIKIIKTINKNEGEESTNTIYPALNSEDDINKFFEYIHSNPKFIKVFYNTIDLNKFKAILGTQYAIFIHTMHRQNLFQPYNTYKNEFLKNYNEFISDLFNETPNTLFNDNLALNKLSNSKDALIILFSKSNFTSYNIINTINRIFHYQENHSGSTYKLITLVKNLLDGGLLKLPAIKTSKNSSCKSRLQPADQARLLKITLKAIKNDRNLKTTTPPSGKNSTTFIPNHQLENIKNITTFIINSLYTKELQEYTLNSELTQEKNLDLNLTRLILQVTSHLQINTQDIKHLNYQHTKNQGINNLYALSISNINQIHPSMLNKDFINILFQTGIHNQLSIINMADKNEYQQHKHHFIQNKYAISNLIYTLNKTVSNTISGKISINELISEAHSYKDLFQSITDSSIKKHIGSIILKIFNNYNSNTLKHNQAIQVLTSLCVLNELGAFNVAEIDHSIEIDQYTATLDKNSIKEEHYAKNAIIHSNTKPSEIAQNITIEEISKITKSNKNRMGNAITNIIAALSRPQPPTPEEFSSLVNMKHITHMITLHNDNGSIIHNLPFNQINSNLINHLLRYHSYTHYINHPNFQFNPTLIMQHINDITISQTATSSNPYLTPIMLKSLMLRLNDSDRIECLNIIHKNLSPTQSGPLQKTNIITTHDFSRLLSSLIENQKSSSLLNIKYLKDLFSLTDTISPQMKTSLQEKFTSYSRDSILEKYNSTDIILASNLELENHQALIEAQSIIDTTFNKINKKPKHNRL